jgi:hypothetical protein
VMHLSSSVWMVLGVRVHDSYMWRSEGGPSHARGRADGDGRRATVRGILVLPPLFGFEGGDAGRVQGFRVSGF